MISTDQPAVVSASNFPKSDHRENFLIAQWAVEHGDAIISKLERMGIHRDDAEDALQDTWKKIVQGAMPRATTSAEIRAWLVTTARRAAVDARRKRRREDRHWTEIDETAVVSHEVDPLNELCLIEDAEIIEEAESKLSMKHVSAIRLYRNFGKKSDVAKCLGVSNAAAGKLVDRAIEQLIRHLKALGAFVD